MRTGYSDVPYPVLSDPPRARFVGLNILLERCSWFLFYIYHTGFFLWKLVVYFIKDALNTLRVKNSCGFLSKRWSNSAVLSLQKSYILFMCGHCNQMRIFADKYNHPWENNWETAEFLYGIENSEINNQITLEILSIWMQFKTFNDILLNDQHFKPQLYWPLPFLCPANWEGGSTIQPLHQNTQTRWG